MADINEVEQHNARIASTEQRLRDIAAGACGGEVESDIVYGWLGDPYIHWRSFRDAVVDRIGQCPAIGKEETFTELATRIVQGGK